MAKWSLKNRKSDVEDKLPQMPPELSDYYNAEKRDRMWASWLLGFATLVVTILLAVLLFLAGRWVVDRFIGDEVDSPETTQEDVGNADNNGSQDDADSNTRDDESVAGSNDQEDEPSEPGGVVDDEAAVTGEPLPDTGPGDTLAIFLIASVLGTLAHKQLLRQKSHQ